VAQLACQLMTASLAVNETVRTGASVGSKHRWSSVPTIHWWCHPLLYYICFGTCQYSMSKYQRRGLDGGPLLLRSTPLAFGSFDFGKSGILRGLAPRSAFDRCRTVDARIPPLYGFFAVLRGTL
jgi:hypothetical protein